MSDGNFLFDLKEFSDENSIFPEKFLWIDEVFYDKKIIGPLFFKEL